MFPPFSDGRELYACPFREKRWQPFKHELGELKIDAVPIFGIPKNRTPFPRILAPIIQGSRPWASSKGKASNKSFQIKAVENLLL